MNVYEVIALIVVVGLAGSLAAKQIPSDSRWPWSRPNGEK